MVKVLYNNKVIADSQDTVTFEGNYYFPPESIKSDTVKLIKPSTTYVAFIPYTAFDQLYL
jgi:uncharacterized protein (DUF427 family)